MFLSKNRAFSRAFQDFAAIIVVLVAVNRILADDPSVVQSPKLPTFSTVRAIIEKSLAKDRKYQPGDLISQGQVKQIFAELKSAGWTLPEAAAILSQVPSDSEFITTTLRAEGARSFMSKVASIPQGYDRVDRLSRIPKGEGSVRQLSQTIDGYKMIEYMAESTGGRNLGTMLAADHGGKDFNKSTGRIYSAAQLIERLQALHAAAAKKGK